MARSQSPIRFRIPVRVVTWLCVASSAVWGLADDPAPPYRAWKVTTELQRHLAGPGVAALLLVDADAVCNADTLDSRRLDFLDRATFRGDQQETVVLAFLTSRPVRADERSRKILELAVRAFLQDLTQTRPRVQWTYAGGNQAFARTVAGLERADDDEAAAEPVVTKEQFRAAAPRTPLSRYLGDACDVYVELLAVWEGADAADLDDELRRAIRATIDELEPLARKRLLLSVRSRGAAGREAVERFVETRRQPLAEELGFEALSVRHTPK